MENLSKNKSEETRKTRVLVADDEETFRKALVYFLESTNQYEVDFAESGNETLEALQEQAYDVVILDHMMPGLTGLNVLQRMYEQKMETPVIMFTGAGSENIAVEAMKLGAYDYIRKDFFDLNHLPILINGVHERFRFKKERMLNDDLQRKQDHNFFTADLMRNYISISTQLMNTTLSALSIVIEDMEKELRSSHDEESKRYIENASITLKKSFQIISFGTKSLLHLTKTIYNRLDGSLDIQKDIEELDVKLKLIKEKMTA